MIDSTQNTTVSVQLAAGESVAEVFVAAGTLMDQSGNPFTGKLSITEVPAERTPAALPPNLFPDVVVTIQPGEMIFTQPAPLTLPNRAGFAPGTLMDLWSINPVTGEFEIVGSARVSDDGSQVETVTGGIRNSSWHFVAPPPPPPEVIHEPDEEPGNQKQQCPVCELSVESLSRVELHSGALLETHDLVPYESLGSVRGLTLNYDSERADPQPIIHFGFDNVVPNTNQRLVASLTFSRGDFEIQTNGFAGGLRLPGGEHFWQLPTDFGDVTVVLQGDLRGQPSGRYDYEINQGLLLLGNNGFSGTTTSSRGQVVVVNAADSPLGAGWQLGGVQQLVENPDGSVLLIDGDGTNIIFEPPQIAGDPFQSPAGDFSTLMRNADGTFTRTTTEQTVFEFDAQGRLLTTTDRNGNVTTHVYVNDRLTQIIDPVGLVTAFTYTGNRITSITDPADRVTAFRYDTAGNLVEITDPDGTSRQFEYDGQHHLTVEINQLGFREETVYGFHGRVERSIRRDGTEQSFSPVQTQLLLPAEATIDPINAPMASRPADPVAFDRDAGGNVTQTILDQGGQLVSANDAAGPTTTIDRNDDNLVTSLTNGRGNVTSFNYDANGNLTAVSDALSGVAITGSLFVGEKYPVGLGASSVAVADLNGDTLLDLVTANFISNDVSVLLGNGDGTFAVATNFAVGSLPFSVAVADFNADTRLDVVTANINGNDVSVLLGNGDGTFAAATNFAAGTGTESVAVADLNGDSRLDLVVANSGSNDVSVLLGLDPGSRSVTAERFFTYDPLFNQLTSITDELGRQSLFDIDPTNGNVLSTTRVIGELGGGDDVVTTFTYTVQGLIDTQTDPFGRVTDLDYDNFGRLVTLTLAVGTTDEASQLFEYDAIGNQTAFIDESGQRTEFVYDSLNRLTRLAHGSQTETVAFYDFTYDGAGRITSLTDIDGPTTFSYDDRNQLTAADRSDADNPDEDYEYDANGNRVSSITHGDGYVTGPGNRLLSDGTFNYEYDNEGNMIRRTEIATGNIREFEWDHRNRLAAVVDKAADGTETQRVEYTYDVFGRRISKAVDTTPADAIDAFFTHFIYDREDVLLDFTDADGSGPAEPVLDQRYLHGPGIDQVFAQEDGAGNLQWLLTDHLGTTRDLIDNTGLVVNHIKYDSFGNVVVQSDPLISTRYLFTGREFDAETGLYYYRTRYYDASIGRFISEDPVRVSTADANLYRYVRNRSIDMIDPTGLRATIAAVFVELRRIQQDARMARASASLIQQVNRAEAQLPCGTTVSALVVLDLRTFTVSLIVSGEVILPNKETVAFLSPLGNVFFLPRFLFGRIQLVGRGTSGT